MRIRNVLLVIVIMLFAAGCATTPEPAVTEPQPVAETQPVVEEPAPEPVEEVTEEIPRQEVEEAARDFEMSQRKGM